MKLETLLQSASDRLDEWKAEEPEDMTVDAMRGIIEVAKQHVEDRSSDFMIKAIQLAYAIMGS